MIMSAIFPVISMPEREGPNVECTFLNVLKSKHLRYQMKVLKQVGHVFNVNLNRICLIGHIPYHRNKRDPFYCLSDVFMLCERESQLTFLILAKRSFASSMRMHIASIMYNVVKP